MLAAITSFLGALNPLVGIFGAGIGVLFTYLVNRYIQRRQQEQAASDAMDQDMSAHSGDGAISVGDMQSAQEQIQDLKNQFAKADAQKAAAAEKPKGQ